MSAASNIPDEFRDDFECPMCYEQFTDPQILQCHHTLCKGCVDVWMTNDEIVCPVCRKTTLSQNIEPDFKTNKLMEKYKANREAGQPSSCKKNAVQCNLCEERPTDTHCKACRRFFCKTCQNTHANLTNCEAEAGEKLEIVIAEIRKELDEKINESVTQSNNLTKIKMEVVEETNNTSERCLAELDEEEHKTITEVRKWYEKQKDAVRRNRDDHIMHTERHYEDLMEKLKQMTQHIDEMKSNSETLLIVNESLQEKIDTELSKLKNESFPSMQLVLKNRGLNYFDASKAPIVENNFSTVKAAQGNCFSGFMRCLKFLTEVHRVSQSSDDIQQLQMVEGQLWALTEDSILVLGKDGSVINKLQPGLSRAWDMCVTVVDCYVIVADAVKGLLQLSTDGQLVQQLDAGQYRSVTSCGDHQVIWAIKQERDFSSGLSICKFDFYTKDQLDKLETDIKPGVVYCAMLNNELYICSFNDHCVYHVSTQTGVTLSVYGERSSGTTVPGELNYPYAIYSDDVSRSLLVADRGNHRLQVLDVSTSCWTVVNTVCGKLKLPETVAVDHERNIWVSSGRDILCMKAACM